MDNIIFVAGYICSGKTYHANEIADDKDYDMIEVSSIVREILDTNERSKLQGHPELEDQMRSFTGMDGGEDDRVDALVHCLTEVILDIPSQGLW